MKDSQLELLSNTKQEEGILTAELEGKLNTKNELMNDLDSSKQSLNGIDNGETIDSVKNHIADLEKEIYNIESSMSRYSKVDIPLDDLIKANIYLEELTSLVGNVIFLVSDTRLDEVIHKYVSDGAGFYSRVSNTRERLKQSIQSSDILKILGENKNLELPKYNVECKTNSCPYMEFFNQYMLMVNREIEEFNKTHKKEQAEFEEIEEMYKCVSILQEATRFIKSHKDILFRLPKEVFNPDIYLLKFLDNRTIYNVDILTEMIESVENRKRINELQSELELAKYKYQVYENNQTLYKELVNRIVDIEFKILKTDDSITSLRHQISDKQSDIRVIQSKLERIDKSIQSKRAIEECRKTIDKLASDIRKMEDIMSEVDRLNTLLTQYRTREREISTNLSKLRNSKQTCEVTMTNIESLEKEEIEIREKYDDIMEIRKAVSPVTGIPVEFIDFYVKSEMVDRINHLLDSVYHGKLKLRGDLVTINDKEFTIPYQKHNTIVKDISKASDGERAILTFAFSLVLIQSSMDKYNIMLLDEIDTSLDHYGRSKFINLLETFMETIGAEQIFMISHNNMFDSYPVNVIMTSEMNLSNMSKASITKLYD